MEIYLSVHVKPPNKSGDKDSRLPFNYIAKHYDINFTAFDTRSKL